MQAKARFIEVAAEFEREWAAMQADTPPLTEKQLRGLAGEFYRWLIAKHDDNPGSATRWGRGRQASPTFASFIPRRRVNSPTTAARCDEVPEGTRHRARAATTAIALTCVAMRAGKLAKKPSPASLADDYSADPVAQRFPEW